MTFLNPGFLALAALAIPLVALYILKLRRRDVKISSTMLWERAVKDVQANAPFQRLRQNLLLLLQLLLLALLVFALARPAWKRSSSPGKAVVLVIDTSASMGAKDGEGTRLDRAKKAAQGVLANMGDSDEAMVVEAWSGARVATAMTRDRSAVEKAIEGLEVRDTTTNVEEALLLAATTVEKREGAAVILLSDGAGATIPSHPVLEKSLTYVKCGAAADNCGITAFRAEPVLGTDGRIESRSVNGRTEYPWSIFAGVSNFSASPKKLYASLRAQGNSVAVRAVELAPGATGGASFDVMLPAEIAVEVALDEPDALAADNRAITRLAEPGNVRIAFSGENKFAKSFLSSRPRVSIVTENPDLWVCEGPAIEPPAGADALYFRPDRAVAGISPGEEMPRVKALSWDETSPLLRFAKFGDVHVSRAVRLSIPVDAENLVQGTSGPLIAVVREKGRMRIVVAFRPGDSDWPLRPSFPIFLANTVRAVANSRAGWAPTQIAAGAPAKFEVAAGKLFGPDGKERVVVASGGGLVCADTDRAGLYRFNDGSREMSFGVNLLSERESNLAPAEALGSGSAAIPATAAPGQENRDLWPWAAAAAVALFLVEWACFHRRIA